MHKQTNKKGKKTKKKKSKETKKRNAHFVYTIGWTAIETIGK